MRFPSDDEEEEEIQANPEPIIFVEALLSTTIVIDPTPSVIEEKPQVPMEELEKYFFLSFSWAKFLTNEPVSPNRS